MRNVQTSNRHNIPNCQTYLQTSVKIAYSNITGFIKEFNRLNVSADFPYTIKHTTPTSTDARSWCEVNYYKAG